MVPSLPCRRPKGSSSPSSFPRCTRAKRVPRPIGTRATDCPSAQTGSPSRLLLDVGGYRATRRKELAAIAKNAAEKVKEYGEPVRLEPMSAFERKCVHDVINALAGVESESEGVEPSRRIVVRPAAG